MNETEWEQHENLWGCVHHSYCTVERSCYMAKVRNVMACAPYPGPPNHQVPAFRTEYWVEIQHDRIISWWRYAGGSWGFRYLYLKEK